MRANTIIDDNYRSDIDNDYDSARHCQVKNKQTNKQTNKNKQKKKSKKKHHQQQQKTHTHTHHLLTQRTLIAEGGGGEHSDLETFDCY